MYNVCTIMYTHIRSQASDWEREREIEMVEQAINELKINGTKESA